MEDWYSIVAALIPSLVLPWFVLWIGYTIWWRPKSIERKLKQQGIMGSPYKLLFGDMEEFVRSYKEATSKPMDLNHSISHRALPFLRLMRSSDEGKISFLWVGTTPRLIIRDPEMIKEVLTNKCGQFQLMPLNPFQKLIAQGVSSVEGDKFVHRRSILTPAFHLTKLKEMVPAFCTSCRELIDRWEELVGPNGYCELDVWPELQNMTGDAISRTAFGSSFKEGRRIFKLQQEQTALAVESGRSLYIPGFKFIPTKKNKRRYYLDREIKSMLRVLIHRKKNSINMGECSGEEDLLGMMLHSNNNEVRGHVKNSTLKGLTVEEVIEECKLFYFAGHETTANLLTWTMILLSMHPTWQDQAREEVRRICGSNTPNFESISQLKIVNMILHEVLRLYPPVAGQYRHVYNKTKLGEIAVPAGVDLVLPTIHIHHDLQIWGADAEEFRPERFSEGVLKATNNRFTFFPFGWGQRTCIGQNFAMIEAKIALAMILQHFSFDLSPSYAHAPYSIVTLQPQYGAQVILRRL